MTHCIVCRYKLIETKELSKGFCKTHWNVPKLCAIIMSDPPLHWSIRVRYLAELHRICRIKNPEWKIKDTAEMLLITASYAGKLFKLAVFLQEVPNLKLIASWENAYKLILAANQNDVRLREILRDAVKKAS